VPATSQASSPAPAPTSRTNHNTSRRPTSGKAVQSEAGAFALAANERGVRLSVNGNDALPVVIDRDRFERALANILDNALRYAPDNSTIAITCGRDADGAFVRVSDARPGIEPDLLPRIFEPTVRGNHARNTSGGGAGLGLTIAARLLESQGGTISAANRPDGGANLTLRLPRTGPA
jgi:signal transduction histidine kinase